MGMEALLTLVVLICAVGLFVSEKLPVDVVALLVLASLLVLGLVSPEQALSGFSSEATITVAAMFVLSAGLQRSGLLRRLGEGLAKIRWQWMQALLIMLVIGPISAFVNNTAAVAVFLPLVLAACVANNKPASRLLIPLSYAAQMGGVCTLIGTSTNLLVNSMVIKSGMTGFTLFEFSQLGVIFLGAGIAYLLITGPWLLPDRAASEFHESAQLGKYVTELRVSRDSGLIGKSLNEVQSRQSFGLVIIVIMRGDNSISDLQNSPIELGDILLAQGEWPQLVEFGKRYGLRMETEDRAKSEHHGDAVLVEAMIAPNSRMADHTLSDLEFRRLHRMTILAIHRRGEVVRHKISELRLAVGDLLLMAVPPKEMVSLRKDASVVIVSEKEQEKISWLRAGLSIAIMASVVAVATQGWLPIVASALVGCIALVIFKCLTPEEAYTAIDWRVVMLMAGVLPLGVAIQTSGLATYLVQHTLEPLNGYGPLVVLAVIYSVTALLTEFMSNTAAAVLLTPIALTTSEALGIDAKPLIVAVMFAASTSFATPVGYQTNTMVYNAGGYRFTDFMKIGIPLNILFFILAMIFIPRYFPF